MPGTYEVEAADVAAELPGIRPVFSPATKPTQAQVEEWILTADTIVEARIERNTGAQSVATDRVAALARRYIIDYTKARVLEVVYSGEDPTSMRVAVEPYLRNAADMLDAIDTLGTAAAGADPAPFQRVFGGMTERAFLVDDDDLQSGARRSLKY